MTIETISARRAVELIEKGAVLVDIRDADERARARFGNSVHLPMSKLDAADMSAYRGKQILFHCKSGGRTRIYADRLSNLSQGHCEPYIVEGGLDGLKAAGLPITFDRRRPIELQRQVQITAGSLALAGTVLGVWVSPSFLAVPAFIGAGLLYAGLTGRCGITRLILHAPWNRALAAGGG